MIGKLSTDSEELPNLCPGGAMLTCLLDELSDFVLNPRSFFLDRLLTYSKIEEPLTDSLEGLVFLGRCCPKGLRGESIRSKPLLSVLGLA